MPKYRLIQRKDRLYQYEWTPVIKGKDEPDIWYRIECLLFSTEDEARRKILDIIEFTCKTDIERVVDIIEV